MYTLRMWPDEDNEVRREICEPLNESALIERTVLFTRSGHKKTRQRPTFPQNHSCSIIGAVELNFRVRDGNGCGLYAMVTGKI